MVVGKFDPELKADIDAVQKYIDILWTAGYKDLAMKWAELIKKELTNKIGMIE